MSEKVVYPQITGYNWPSSVLHVWLTLRELGVPEKNLRFLPEIAHFAAPEVIEEPLEEDADPQAEQMSLRHPHGPQLDTENDRLIVQRIDPSEIRPRLKVNVRAETVWHLLEEIEGGEARYHEEVVGRLQNFMEPLMADLPGAAEAQAPEEREAAFSSEKPLDRLTRQVCERYPELTTALPDAVRQTLQTVAENLEKALLETDPKRRQSLLRQTAESLPAQVDLNACRAAFLEMVNKLFPGPEDGLDGGAIRSALIRFRDWAGALFLVSAGERLSALERSTAALSVEEIRQQAILLSKLLRLLPFEQVPERHKIVRELMEILTTEVFTSVAVLDHLWGLGWIHGFISDFRLDTQPARHEGLFLSVTGGQDRRALLLFMIRQWADAGAFLGVGRSEMFAAGGRLAGSECLDMTLFDAGEQMELWALTTWRREAADPVALLETAARRLVHPDVVVRLKPSVGVVGRFGSLFAQLPQQGLGGTAVLGQARLHYPGVWIYIPLAEDADDTARKAKATLKIVLRLFLPIGLRVEIFWKQAIARLDGASYLYSDPPQELRLADLWTALNPGKEDETVDPLLL